MQHLINGDIFPLVLVLVLLFVTPYLLIQWREWSRAYVEEDRHADDSS